MIISCYIVIYIAAYIIQAKFANEIWQEQARKGRQNFSLLMTIYRIYLGNHLKPLSVVFAM